MALRARDVNCCCLRRACAASPQIPYSIWRARADHGQGSVAESSLTSSHDSVIATARRSTARSRLGRAMTDWAAHPLGDEGVVEVRLNFSGSMSPITAYDDSTCDATVSIPVFYEWIDPRMADFAEGEPLPENLWQPEFHIYGGTNNADYGYGGAAGSLTLKDRATGCMLWMIVTNGVVYSCRASHDITDFPFDSQIVTIFFSCGKTVAGATDRVKYSVDRDFVQFAGRGSLAPRIERQSEWEVTGLAYGINQHSSSVKSYHNAYVAFKRQRIPSWYLHKGLAPTVMCAVLSLTATSCLRRASATGWLSFSRYCSRSLQSSGSRRTVCRARLTW